MTTTWRTATLCARSPPFSLSVDGSGLLGAKRVRERKSTRMARATRVLVDRGDERRYWTLPFPFLKRICLWDFNCKQ